MGPSISTLRCFSTALVLACLLGCASRPKAHGRSVLLGTQDRILLILPLNVATAMPRDLEPIGPIVWKEIERYLKKQDKQLKTVSRETAHKLWIKSIKQVRAGELGKQARYDDAARALVVELRKHAEFDALIAPSLFIQKAPFANRTAHWDGVERELEFAARGLEARNLASTPLEGAAPAASLHIAVFDAQGNKVHEAKGGLELLVRIRVTGTAESGQPSFEFEPRDDLLEDSAALREGVAAAFEAYVSPAPE